MTCSPVTQVGDHVRDNCGALFADAALGFVGVPFRLHGRSERTGFDCVGLVLASANAVGIRLNVPAGYSMRSAHPEYYARWFDQPELRRVLPHEQGQDGDIAIVRPSAQQLHFMIRAGGGFVHAHASLRRVVHMPAPSPWPVWRGYRLSPPD